MWQLKNKELVSPKFQCRRRLFRRSDFDAPCWNCNCKSSVFWAQVRPTEVNIQPTLLACVLASSQHYNIHCGSSKSSSGLCAMSVYISKRGIISVYFSNLQLLVISRSVHHLVVVSWFKYYKQATLFWCNADTIPVGMLYVGWVRFCTFFHKKKLNGKISSNPKKSTRKKCRKLCSSNQHPATKLLDV